MELKDFLQIAEYGNIAWKGSFTKEEVEENGYEYYHEFRWSKRNQEPSFVITELISLLKEDGSEKCLEWAERITREINGCE